MGDPVKSPYTACGLLCLCLLVVKVTCAPEVSGEDEGSDCFVKWVHGYRLASGRPQKILHSVSLEICKQECASTVGCAAFAFGTTKNSSASQSTSTSPTSICELAINSRLRSSSTSPRKKSYDPPPPRTDSFFSPSSSTRFFAFNRDGRSITTTSPTDQNATSTAATPTISIQDLDRSPTYDVYIENPNSNDPCFKRDALYESGYPINNQIGPGSGSRYEDRGFPASHQNGVPIDCFYRLMSGKRLVKTHTLRAISVNSLQECQEACIHERSFNCRSISYRYMPSSGYSYPVSNCEMSSYYMQSGTLSSSYSKLDFVEDYDYDYFQRETHCKTTSSTTLGVCAVVVRRGGRVSTTLIKSSHHTVTSSQCEHLCATSLFRCRAFAFRHTTRGRDPYVSNRYPPSTSLTPTRDLPPPSEHSCLLYDTDLMRLPSYNIEPDQDFDLFEMGRLMGAECVLYEQFLNRRPGYYNPGPVTSTMGYPPVENRDYYGGGGGGVGDRGTFHPQHHQQHGMNGGSGSSRERDRVDQHLHGTGMNYLINREVDSRGQYGGMREHVRGPPSTLETGLMIGGDRVAQVGGVGFGGDRGAAGSFGGDRGAPVGGSFGGDHRGSGGEFDRPAQREEERRGGSGLVNRPLISGEHSYTNSSVGGSGGGSHGAHGTEPPYYDKGKESCLRVFRQDSYLIPEVSRATFPVKTLDECRVECIRSLEVLRFPCRAMAYRHTSHSSIDRVSGGTCQLSDNDPREPDLVPSRDRYEGAVTFIFDDREVGCGRGGGAAAGSYDRDRDRGYYDDSRGRDRYNTGYNDYYNNRNVYKPPYQQPNSYDRHYSYDRDRTPSSSYYPAANRYYDQDRRWSGGGTAAPANYNPHYWDYHNRYGGSGVGGGGGGGKYYGAASSHQFSEYPNGQGGTTVNGERCMRGCRQNRDAGFYYCQIDEQGAWDFCCRPDHFCGYSKGLSVPWCYVGAGPSQNIWRSCEAKGSRNNPFFTQPNVAYLHDRLPPTVHKLTNTQVANLTKDNAIRLFTNNTMSDQSPIEDVGWEDKVNDKFVAKPVGGSQEVIVRVSNSTSSDTKKGDSGGKKS